MVPYVKFEDSSLIINFLCLKFFYYFFQNKKSVTSSSDNNGTPPTRKETVYAKMVSLRRRTTSGDLKRFLSIPTNRSSSSSAKVPFIYYVCTFLGFLHPPPPYVSMFLVLKISKNWHFLTPPPSQGGESQIIAK